MLKLTTDTSRLYFREQIKLLSIAERKGEPLAEVLSRAGWSYDDLVYENSMTKAWKGGRATTLEDFRDNFDALPVVSFFTGCGGMDLGLEAVGFEHRAAFEFNELFCKTLRHNRPQWKVFGPPTHSGDVSKFEEVANVLSDIIRTPFEGVFVGGPPCQPFSIAANQRFAKWGDNFKRTGFSHKKTEISCSTFCN